MYLALRRGRRTFTQGYTCPVLLWKDPRVFFVSDTGLLPAMASRSRDILLQKRFVTLCRLNRLESSEPPKLIKTWVWALPLSLAATKGITYLSIFLLLLSCFSSQSSLYVAYNSPCGKPSATSYQALSLVGFPHSEIPE